ncbi:MAG TPA: type II toxin-antitoxin system VapC family toxin [Mucilaginibacter sp.]
MGPGYLIDTNTIIDYLENRLPVSSTNLIDRISIQLSVISRIEILAWQKASDEHLRVLNGFMSASTVFNLDENIILKSIEIRKIYRLKLPDAIIAATAATKNLKLLTRNLKDFERIIDLQCIDPHRL